MWGCAALNGAEGMSSLQEEALLQPQRGPSVPSIPPNSSWKAPPGARVLWPHSAPCPVGHDLSHFPLPSPSPQLGCFGFKLALGNLRATERLGWICRVRGRVQEHLGSPKTVKMCSVTCGTCMSSASCHPAAPPVQFDHLWAGFSWELRGRGCWPVPPHPGMLGPAPTTSTRSPFAGSIFLQQSMLLGKCIHLGLHLAGSGQAG